MNKKVIISVFDNSIDEQIIIDQLTPFESQYEIHLLNVDPLNIGLEDMICFLCSQFGKACIEDIFYLITNIKDYKELMEEYLSEVFSQVVYWNNEGNISLDKEPLILKSNLLLKSLEIHEDYLKCPQFDLIAKLETYFSKNINPLDQNNMEAALEIGEYIAEDIKMSGKVDFYFYIVLLEAAYKKVDGYGKIFIKSLLMHFDRNRVHINQIYDLALSSSILNLNERVFVYNQCISNDFNGIVKTSSETGHLNTKLYHQIIHTFEQALNMGLRFIPVEERVKDLVIVFTAQFLNLNHAPTKTALDRCYTLIKHMNKRVLLINTCELLPQNKQVPFYHTATANREEITEDLLAYKDVQIPYYQCSVYMPNFNEMRDIITTVQKLKPYCIMTIGASITADLCRHICPNLVIATVFSSVPHTLSQFRVVGRKVGDAELENLEEKGITKDSIIESTFTFDFKPQTHYFTRKDLGLPTDKFLIAVVGARLSYEMKDNFIEMFKQTVIYDTHLVIIGEFDFFEEYTLKDEAFKKHITNLGYQQDVLAIIENCDLYANPPRAGGGSSAAEALYKGVPVVSLNNGDVSVAVGKEFTVHSLDEMKEKIIQYVIDEDYYRKMSRKGKKRAEILLDTNKAFEEVLNTAAKRQAFVKAPV